MNALLAASRRRWLKERRKRIASSEELLLTFAVVMGTDKNVGAICRSVRYLAKMARLGAKLSAAKEANSDGR